MSPSCADSFTRLGEGMLTPRIALLLLLTTNAFAQERPLAITATDVAASSEYADTHLRVGHIVHWRTTFPSFWTVSYPTAWGSHTVVTTTPYAHWPERSLAVLRADRVVDAPTFYQIVDDVNGGAKLNRRIKKNNVVSGAALAVAVGGLVTAIIGQEKMNNAYWEPPARRGTMLREGQLLNDWGAVGLATGLITANFSSARARTLRRSPIAAIGLTEVEERIEQYNESLREELRLSPAKAREIERTTKER